MMGFDLNGMPTDFCIPRCHKLNLNVKSESEQNKKTGKWEATGEHKITCIHEEVCTMWYNHLAISSKKEDKS